jgi:O-antigen ligase
MKSWQLLFKKKEAIVGLLLLLFFVTILNRNILLNSRLIIAILLTTCIVYKFNFNKKLIISLIAAFAPYLIVHLLFAFCNNPVANTLHAISTKASFVAFPIIFSQLPYLPHKNLVHIATKILTTLLIILFAIMLIDAIQKFTLNHNWEYFFYSGLCGEYMHTGYLSNFFMFCFLYYYFQFLKTYKKTNLIIAFVLLAMLVLIACKTAYLCLLLFALVEGYTWFKKIKLIKTKVLMLVTFILFGFVIFEIPPIQKRIMELVNVNKVNVVNVNTTHSTPIRKLIWKSEWEIIKRNPLIGYGTGAVDSLLVIEYKKNNYTYLLENVTGGPLHSHNQFLHQWVDQGILGLLTLIFWLAYCFYFFIKKAYHLGAWWIVFITPVIFTDDVLEIHACVVFIAFSVVLLFWDCWHVHHAKKDNNVLA